MPFKTYRPDPNRLQWAPSAHRLWYRIRNDLPVGKAFADDITTAANGVKPSSKPGKKPTASPSARPSDSATAAQKAAENGLCA